MFGLHAIHPALQSPTPRSGSRPVQKGGVAKRYPIRKAFHREGGDKAQHARMGARPSRVSTKVVSAVADDMDRRVVPVSSRSPSKNSDERATTSVIGTLTEMQLEEFREAFHAFDKDGGGTLDKEELMELFQSLGQMPSSEELDHMVLLVPPEWAPPQ